eukprot:Gb_06337 [translate_table: standard]
MKNTAGNRSHSWLWDSHISPENSKWLQENLEGMDGKVKTMLKLIDEDADSFSERVEMYYKKRPELVGLVEEFYRAYRSLAERYNHLTGQLSKSIPSSLKAHYGMIDDLSLGPQNAGQNKMKDRSVGLGVFPTNTDHSHRNKEIIEEDHMVSDDMISCTTSSHTEFENLQKSHPELQQLKEDNERLKTDSKKSKEEYEILKQKIRQFEIDILNLKEENELLQKQGRGELDQRTNLQECIARMQTRNSDLESQISTMFLQSKETIDLFQKRDIKLTAELQARVRKIQELEREIHDVQQKLLLSQEENGVLKIEFQQYFQDHDAAEKHVSDADNGGPNQVSRVEIQSDNMKCKLAELQEENALMSRHNEKGIKMGSSVEHNNLQTELSLLQDDNIQIRGEVSVMQQRMKDSGDQTSNLLTEIKNTRNEPSGQLNSMQKQTIHLHQEVPDHTQLSKVVEKQIEDLQQALLNSQSENTRLTDENQRCKEEYAVVNKRSKNLQAELALTRQKNQKLRKELSTKVTELQNLGVMFSSLGKEKEMIAAELLLKVSVLGGMEEDLNDLKERNRILSNKLEAYARQHKAKIRDLQGTVAVLQDRNKILSDQLLKSLEGCRALKRKVKGLQEENRGFHSEIASLKVSLKKQKESAHLLELEKTALQNEISWGKKQLHILQEKCHCFKGDTQPLTDQLQPKPDRQKSFNDEVVILEQLLLHFKEEITCFKVESHKGAKECEKLKGQMQDLQNEVMYLRAENNSLKLERSSEEIVKKLNSDNYYLKNENATLKNEISSGLQQITSLDEECRELRKKMQEMSQEQEKGTRILQHSLQNLKQDNEYLRYELQNIRKDSGVAERRISTISKQPLQLQDKNAILVEQVSSRDDSIKRLNDETDMLFYANENHQAEVIDINMQENKLKDKLFTFHIEDDHGDHGNQVSNKISTSQELEDGVACLEQEKTVLEPEVRSLTKQIMELREVIDEFQKSKAYSSEALVIDHEKELERIDCNMNRDRITLEADYQDLCTKLVVSRQLLTEIKVEFSRLACERNSLVLEVSKKGACISKLKEQLLSSQQVPSGKVDEVTLWVDSEAKLGEEMDHLQEEKRKIQNELQDGMAQIRRFEDDFRNLQEATDSLKQGNLMLKAETENVREECCSFQGSSENLQKELGMANDRTELFQKKNFSLQEENGWLKNNVSEEATVTQTQTLGQEIPMLEGENLSLHKEMSVKVEELGKLNEALQRHLDEPHQENLILNTVSKADGSRIEELQSQVGKLDMEVKILKEENERQSIILLDRAEE